MSTAQRSPNRYRMLRTARLLRPLLGELVFVGGQVAELLVTDPAAVRVRPTDDVDVVVPVTTRTAYHALQQRLMALGFTPDTRAGAPICRMRTVDDLIFDVMPLDESVLGFRNRWYPYALATATQLTLEPGMDVRVAAAAAFLRASFVLSDRTSGARCIPGDLRADGLRISLHNIERSIRSNALRARPTRRATTTDAGDRLVYAIAPNSLDRNFPETAPKQWVADFTDLSTAKGWL